MVFHDTGKGGEQEDILVHILFCQKTPDLRTGQYDQEHGKQEHAAEHIEAHIGTVDKEILVPAGKVRRPAPEAVLLDLCPEKGKGVLLQRPKPQLQALRQRMPEDFDDLTVGAQVQGHCK